MSGSFAHTMSGFSGSLETCLRALEESSVYQEMPPALRFVAELILDEMASNTIKYGGADCHEIVVRIDFDGESMRVEMSDDALPFDPWTAAPIHDDPVPAAIEDLAIGGRGLRMLAEATDSQHYERKGGRNINIMIRNVHRPGRSAAA